jgi:hypothetical protein
MIAGWFIGREAVAGRQAQACAIYCAWDPGDSRMLAAPPPWARLVSAFGCGCMG